MLLPGGLVDGGVRRRDFSFRSIDGELELLLADATAGEGLGPHQVTRALAASLDRLAGEPATAERVRSLAVADRQFLVRQLAARFDRDRVWLTVDCGACEERFDFEVRQSTLPVKEAGDGFPVAVAETAFGQCTLRAPTGLDQEAVSSVLGEEDAVAALLARCLVEVDGESRRPTAAELLDARDQLEAAIEAMAPEVALIGRALCPECGAENHVGIDPYLCLGSQTDDLLAEVHALASAYHWSEPEILALPRRRRHQYLELIDRSRGVTQ